MKLPSSQFGRTATATADGEWTGMASTALAPRRTHRGQGTDCKKVCAALENYIFKRAVVNAPFKPAPKGLVVSSTMRPWCYTNTRGNTPRDKVYCGAPAVPERNMSYEGYVKDTHLRVISSAEQQ